MTAVLVTGSDGFLGRAAARARQIAESIRKIIPSFHFDVTEVPDDMVAPQFDTNPASRDFDLNATTDLRIGTASLIASTSSSEMAVRYARSA